MSFPSRIFQGLKKDDHKPPLPGLTICILQTRLERYTTDRLNAAMQAAWTRPYDPVRFFGMNLDNENGFVKLGDMFIPIYFRDRRLDPIELGNLPLPTWADHRAFCEISFKTSDGLPDAISRRSFTGLVSLLALELADTNTVGFFYVEDGAFVRPGSLTKAAIFQSEFLDPTQIAEN